MRNAKLTEVDAEKQMRANEKTARYLEGCLRENDSGLLAAALGKIARTKGITQLARDTGIRRTTLYRVLSIDADPSFSAILKVTRALGLQLCFVAVPVREDSLNER